MKKHYLITISLIILFNNVVSSQNNIDINGISSKKYQEGIKLKSGDSTLINSKRFRELILNSQLQTDANVKLNDTILLDLFNNKKYKAIINKIQKDVNGTLTIASRLVGYDFSYCIISTFKNKSFMTIEIPEKDEYYKLKFDQKTKKYFLLEIDKSKQRILEEGPSIIPLIDSQSKNNKKNSIQKSTNKNIETKYSDLLFDSNLIQKDATSQDIIKLMIVYTSSAAEWASNNETNIATTISNLMTKANLALDNSNTLLTLNLVHTEQIEYNETDSENDLFNLRNKSDGYMDTVHVLRDLKEADLVVLLAEIDYTGGQGYLLTTYSGLPDYGFSITRVQQASDSYTTIHEIGHNLGCGHHKLQNYQAGPNDDLNSYSAGWRWTGTDNEYCSLMCYEDGKYYSDGITHHRVAYFSNPNIQFQNVATGDTEDGDNARTIRDTKAVVASYRTDTKPPHLLNTGYSTEVTTNITITFNEPIDQSTINSSNIIINGSSSGLHAFTFSYNTQNNILTIDPTVNFNYGETVNVSLSSGIKDIAGNGLDGDGDGDIGPNYSFSFTTNSQVYTHDFALTSISASNVNPMVNDLVTIYGIVKNVGQVTEPSGQLVSFYDNEIEQPNYYTIPTSLAPGDEHLVNITWQAKTGAHNLKIKCELTGDQNVQNNEKSISIVPGTSGQLMVDGEANPVKSINLSAGSFMDITLQLNNQGSAAIDASISKAGTVGNWVNLSEGNSVHLNAYTTTSYTFRVSVPSSTTIGAYNGSVVFSYEGSKTSVLTINVNVVQYQQGLFQQSLEGGTVLIDGTNKSNTIYPFGIDYLDNDPLTGYPTSQQITLLFSNNTIYNSLNYARWTVSASKIKSQSNLRISIPEGNGYREYSSTVSNSQNDILGWFVTGNNSMLLSLDDFVHDRADALWDIQGPAVQLGYSNAGWGKDCQIPNVDAIKDGLDYCRIYFDVVNVMTPGILSLYNSGTGSRLDYESIDGSDAGDTKYFTLTSSEFNSSNYFAIRGDATNQTKAEIRNIRIEIHYYSGDPNLRCIKTLSTPTASVNEDITVNLNIENVGSNMADRTTYNDSPLPDGIALISGSLSEVPDNVRPGEIITAQYVIRPQRPGSYTFGATAVTYEDLANNEYQSTFNAVNLIVNGGNLLVTGSLNGTDINPGESVVIAATALESIGNTAITDAVLTCSLTNLTTNQEFDPFYLIYNTVTGKYEGAFSNTLIPGQYEVQIIATKEYYGTGNLTVPLTFTVAGPPYLNVEPLIQTVTHEAGICNYTINSNVVWNIEENYDWLSATKIGDNLLQVQYAKNMDPSEKTALIKLTSTELSDRGVMLIQEGNMLVSDSLALVAIYNATEG